MGTRTIPKRPMLERSPKAVPNRERHSGGLGRPSSIAIAVFCVTLFAPQLFAQIKVDPGLQDYKPVVGVSGNINSKGSDTMNNLMTHWAEGFRKFYPAVRVEVEGKGSNTAVTALIEGSATFGAMSRVMKPAEVDGFEKKFGYKPVALNTGIDSIAIFVNKDTPLDSITFSQADAIFSATRKLGHSTDITKWGELGLTGEWQSARISLYGRNSASGTYGFFKERVLAEGDFKNTVKEQAGSSTVIQAIAKDRFAIGYSGISYKTPDVKALSLVKNDSSETVTATTENVYNGKYPLSRFLLLYTNMKPGAHLDPLRREFIQFIFSKQGQEIVGKDGFYPVTAAIAKKSLKEVGL